MSVFFMACHLPPQTPCSSSFLFYSTAHVTTHPNKHFAFFFAVTPHYTVGCRAASIFDCLFNACIASVKVITGK